MAVGASVDDGGEVPAEVVGVADVALAEGEGKFHGGLGGPGELAVMPGLAVDHGFSTRAEQVEEGLAIGRKVNLQRNEVGQERSAFAVGQREVEKAFAISPGRFRKADDGRRSRRLAHSRSSR